MAPGTAVVCCVIIFPITAKLFTVCEVTGHLLGVAMFGVNQLLGVLAERRVGLLKAQLGRDC